MKQNPYKAVFLDRDGTLSEDVGYIDNVGDFRLYGDTCDALKRLSAAGFKLIVVTNQSGVARGYFPESCVVEINDHMSRLLGERGITLDGIYYCPYFTGGSVPEYAIDAPCRKPDTGMILEAVDDIGIDLGRSYMVGDSDSDIMCGKNAGLRTVLVRTGHGREAERKIDMTNERERPECITDSIGEAATWIINDINR